MDRYSHNARLLHPKYWLAWFSLGILWLLIKLPYAWSTKIGKQLGRILYFFPTEIKNTTAINLRLCFPEKSAAQLNKMAAKNFEFLGIALFESMMAWFSSPKKIRSLFELHGYEHIEKALSQGKAVILITPHFTCIELAARFIGLQPKTGIMYRPHKKPFIHFIHETFRKRHFEHYIPSDRVRQLVTLLKQPNVIWYAYDLDCGEKSGVFAPFFGVPTSTLTSVSRIAQLNDVAVIPMSFYRSINDQIYRIEIAPALENFPSNNLLADATRLNAILEENIREHPEQYVWQYKRFKTRPKGQKRFYFSSHFPPRWIGPSQKQRD